MRRFRNQFPALVLAGGMLAGGGATVRAQEPVPTAVPLSRQPAAHPAPGRVVTQAAAQRAQDLGLPSLAVDLYRELRDAPGADRSLLGLSLATALLDAGEAAEAEKILGEIPPPHGAAWRLRFGLAALHLGKRAVAQQQWDSIREAEVSYADLPWYRFLTGALWDTATPRDVTKANGFYSQAEQLATTPLARARFQLAGERVRLHMIGRPRDEDLRQAQENARMLAGQATGYQFSRDVVVMLTERGQRDEAEKYLAEVLGRTPPQERRARDEFRFLLGLIGDRSLNGTGRAALLQLLDNGQDEQRQRQALQLLNDASQKDPERQRFRRDLDRLLVGKPAPGVLEAAYYYRAQFALVEKDYSRAEADAGALLREFPASPLRVHALTMLAQSAWEQNRFRFAADQARKARLQTTVASAPGAAATPAPREGPPPITVAPSVRFDLGILEAEASFRATDYRSAAEAYAAVLRERPTDLPPERVSKLMFQWVLAEIRAGTAGAAKLLDQLAADPAFDGDTRWEAEWNLARALNLEGREGMQKAYARVGELLRQPDAAGRGINSELRAKMAWLQIRLAFDSGNATEALALAEAQLKTPLEIEPALKAEITSIVTLLKGRAEFALGRESTALETLRNLRSTYPGTDAAIFSYLIEAEHYERQDKLSMARTRLIEITDNEAYKKSPYSPFALYRLALLSERLGQDEDLKEANRRIEDLVTSTAAATNPTLVFAARMRQGDIYRRRNDFPAAQRVYEHLVNTYSQRPDVVYAQLALADCHSMMASPPPGMPADPIHAERAQLLYEKLRDRVDAPRDVNVEAGYKLGDLYLRRGKVEEAAKVWLNDVIEPFLLKDPKPMEADAKRPTWLARTLCDLADLQERRGRREEAKEAYLRLLERGLPYAETARARLQQLGVPAPATKSGQ